jgi:hypothetical protein
MPETAQRIGDRFFRNVDERGDRGQLPEGTLAYGRNIRIRHGIAQTRGGYPVLRCGPSTGITAFTNPQLLRAVRDPGSDPNDPKLGLIVVADGVAYFTRPGQTAQVIPLPSGETLDNCTDIVQAFDVILAARGLAEDPLQCLRLGDGFEAITQRNSGSGNGTGTLTIPPFKYGALFRQRLLVNDAQQLYPSDVRNFTRYAAPTSMAVNPGSADALVRFVPLTADVGIAFKSRSINIISGFDVNAETGDLTVAQNDVLTTTHGLASPKAAVQWGNDIYYVSPQGLMTISLTAQNNTRLAQVPISDPISRTWARVNWQAREAICLGIDPSTNRLYLGLPLDSSTTCNAIAVFDPLQEGWVSVDENLFTTPYATSPVEFAVVNYLGRDRLCFLGTDGLIRLCDEGWHDESLSTRTPFVDLEFVAVPIGTAMREPDGTIMREPSGAPMFEGVAMSIQINGGTVIYANGTSTNGPQDFGSDTLANTITNVQDGYAAGTWSAPNCTITDTALGIRIVATNGVLPVVTVQYGDGVCYQVSYAATYVKSWSIITLMETRGYNVDLPARQQATQFVYHVESLYGQYSGRLFADGVYEISGSPGYPDGLDFSATPSYTVSDRYGAGRSATNDDGRAGWPFFEDYGVRLEPDGYSLGAAGVNVSKFQSARHAVTCNISGRWVASTVTSLKGALKLVGVEVQQSAAPLSTGITR